MKMMGNFKAGANYFGRFHHPAIGIRIPEVFLPGITAALKKTGCAAGLMLSFGRETATDHVVSSAAGLYPITMGHTGTSISHYQKAAEDAALAAGIPVEIEADHLIVTGTPERAATRITGVHDSEKVSEKMIMKSLRYIYKELADAGKVGTARCFTIDTSDLFEDGLEDYSVSALEKRFTGSFPETRQKKLLKGYCDRVFSFTTAKNRVFKIRYSEQSLMRIALRYKTSLEVTHILYNRILKIFGPGFGFEISFDETRDRTRVEDAFYFLSEWTGAGNRFDYFAPNIGFKKRGDYRGSRTKLLDLTSRHAAVASYFNGALLSIHSGSGTSPYSGKGKGVYDALLSATGSKLKYKVSGIYYELLLEMLAAAGEGSAARKLYEDLFDAVSDYCSRELARKGPLATELLSNQWREYKSGIEGGPKFKKDPRHAFFRFHSYLALNLRGRRGARPFREAIVGLYRNDAALRKSIDKEVQALTERLILGLKFNGNFAGKD